MVSTTGGRRGSWAGAKATPLGLFIGIYCGPPVKPSPTWDLTLRRGSEWPRLPHSLCLVVPNKVRAPTPLQAMGPCPLPVSPHSKEAKRTGRVAGADLDLHPAPSRANLVAAGDLTTQLRRGGAHSGLRARSLRHEGPGRQADPWQRAGSEQAPAPTASHPWRMGQAAPPSPAGTCREGAALGWWGPREGVVPLSRLCQVPPTGCSPQRGPRGFPLRHPQPYARRSKPRRAWLWPGSRQLRLLGPLGSEGCVVPTGWGLK